MWRQVSITRHEYYDRTGRMVGCIHLTDLGWMPRVWDTFGHVNVLNHRSDELSAKAAVERVAGL